MSGHTARRDVLELCAEAAEVIKSAGFERRYVSMRTESVYFALPGRDAVLRVSSHGGKSGLNVNGHRVVAKLTFRGDSPGRTTLRCSDEAVENRIVAAIGRYMVRSSARQSPTSAESGRSPP